VAPLPPLTGRVEGKAYEGDHTTPARNAEVLIKSLNPLFNRTWTQYTGNQGEFALQGVVTDSSNSVAVPAGGAVQIDATHGLTRLAAPTYTPSFGEAATLLSQDVVFPSGIARGLVLSPPDYPIRSCCHYVEAFRDGTTSVGSVVYLENDGTYTFPGLQAGTYRLRLTANHNQGSGLTGSVDNVAVTVGTTTTADIPVQPTGGVTGLVKLSATQSAGANHYLTLSGIAGTSAFRSTYSVTSGAYTFTAVPVGRYELTVTDARNGARLVTTIDVPAGPAITQDLILPSTATLQVTVRYARNVVAQSAAVYLSAPSIQGERWIGYTDASGRVDVPVPVGTYTLRVTHPQANWTTVPYDTRVMGTIDAAQANQLIPLSVSLKAVANVRVTVRDADNGNVPVANAQIYQTDGRYSQLYWGNTNSAGQLTVNYVPEGTFSTLARLPDGRSFSTSGTITTADDGLTLDKTISVTSQFDVLGVIGFMGERRLYSVAAATGDVLSFTAYGDAHGGNSPLYLTRLFVYDPDKVLVASGYRYSGFYESQYSDFNDLSRIVATKPGAYTAAVQSYWPDDPGALGSFRLVAQLNGTPVAVTGPPGGTVNGRVLRADGATPASAHTVSIQTMDVLALHVRTVTDEAGLYAFENVPLGEFRVGAVDPDLAVVTVSATGTLPTGDPVTAPDLVLPARSEFTIQVQAGDGSPYGSGIPVVVTDAGGERTLYTDEDGRAFTTGLGTLTASATLGTLSGSATAPAVDGQPVSLTITLVATSLSGFVLDGTGAPAAGRSVDLYQFYWNYLGSTVSGADGSFLFLNVPAGVPLRLVTYDDVLGVNVSLFVTVAPGQSLANQLLRLPGVGSVRGRVQLVDGTGLPNQEVQARYDSGEEYSIYRSTVTDASGEYLFDNDLPSGVPLVVWVNDQYEGSHQVEVTIPAAGQTALAPPIVIEGGSLHFQVLDAAGRPARGSFALYVDGNYHTWTDGTERIYTNIAPGSHQLTLYDYNQNRFIATTDVEVVADVDTPATLVVSVVTGLVRHTNGDPVTSGWVYLATTAGPAYYAEMDAEGRYSVAAPPPGDFTVSANDNDSGFSAEGAGTVPEATTAVTVDLTMPPSGTVSGVFRDAAGSPVPDATVFVRSSGLEFDRYLTTDASGAYTAPHVALGTLTVQAQDPSTGLVAEATAVLSVDQQAVEVNLQVGPGGTLTGLVVESDGSTPVPGAVVTVETVRQQGIFGTFSTQVTADEEGRYTLPSVPAGDLLLSALHPSEPGLAGAARVTLAAEATVDQTLVMGTGVTFNYNLDGQDGFRYDVACQGSLEDGGTVDGQLGDAYDGAYYLDVNGQSFPCFGVGLTTAGGREIRLGPTAFGSLLVSRRIFVPAEGGFVRFLDEVTNESAEEVTVPLQVTSDLGSDGSTVVRVAPADVSGRYAVTADSTSSPIDPPLAHVFFDADPASLGPVYTAFADGYGYGVTQWDLTIPAGETRSILTFGVQRARNDVAGAQAQAESLCAKSAPHMLDGLSTEDRARVRNFTLP
jgi:hypothetical protein